MKDVDLGEPECQNDKDSVDNKRNMFESKISEGASEKYFALRNLAQTFPHHPTAWKVMQRNVWNHIANLRTE